MKKAFTIIELLIVVIIIGVLATIAVPQFTKAVEKTKMGKAKNQLGLIYKAAQMYRAEQSSGEYTGITLTIANDYVEQGIDLATGNDKQSDWTYSVASGTNTMNITADRLGSGAYSNCVLTISQDQVITNATACPR